MLTPSTTTPFINLFIENENAMQADVSPVALSGSKEHENKIAQIVLVMKNILTIMVSTSFGRISNNHTNTRYFIEYHTERSIYYLLERAEARKPGSFWSLSPSVVYQTQDFFKLATFLYDHKDMVVYTEQELTAYVSWPQNILPEKSGRVFFFLVNLEIFAKVHSVTPPLQDTLQHAYLPNCSF